MHLKLMPISFNNPDNPQMQDCRGYHFNPHFSFPANASMAFLASLSAKPDTNVLFVSVK
jgi:hypothetical protein